MSKLRKIMRNKYIFISILLLINFHSILSLLLLNSESQKNININLSSKLSSIKKIGRYYLKNNIIYLAQSGSSIEFYLKAKKGLISIYSDFSYLHENYEKPRYAIYLNDKIFLDTKIQKKEEKILLFDFNQEKKFKIKVILLSEASVGNIGIRNLEINTDINENDIISPTEDKKYLIEFVGDSITCGYGIESNAPNESFDTGTENFEKTYAFLSAKELNFDYSAICYSGCGIITPGNKMINRYSEINSFANSTEWNFKYNNNKKADIIVINLGTNDRDLALSFRGDYYSKDYSNFLQIVREKNPDSIIICIYGMMGREDLFPLILEGIESLNDDKIYGFLFPEQKFEDGYGAQYHPNEVSNKKWAKILTAIIKNILVERNIK